MLSSNPGRNDPPPEMAPVPILLFKLNDIAQNPITKPLEGQWYGQNSL